MRPIVLGCGTIDGLASQQRRNNHCSKNTQHIHQRTPTQIHALVNQDALPNNRPTLIDSAIRLDSRIARVSVESLWGSGHVVGVAVLVVAVVVLAVVVVVVVVGVVVVLAVVAVIVVMVGVVNC